jgi:nickel/cobalt exporter
VRAATLLVQTLPLLAGALLVGVVHMSAPDHWVTLCILGRVSNWSRLRLLGASIITGIGHVALSIALGFAIVALGFAFSGSISGYITEITGGSMLLLGLAYGVWTILSDKDEDYQREAEEKYLLRTREAGKGVGYLAVLGAALSPDLSILPMFLLAIPVGVGLGAETAMVYALGSIVSLALIVLAASYGLAKAFERMPPKYSDASVGFVIAAIGLYILISG